MDARLSLPDARLSLRYKLVSQMLQASLVMFPMEIFFPMVDLHIFVLLTELSN